MTDRRTWLVIVFMGLITMSAMAALVANRGKVTTVCKDLRVAMDGAIDATIESSGLTHNQSITLTKHVTSGRARKEILAVHTPLHHVVDKEKETFKAKDIKLTISRGETIKNGRAPASLDTVIDGKKVTLSLGCTL